MDLSPEQMEGLTIHQLQLLLNGWKVYVSGVENQNLRNLRFVAKAQDCRLRLPSPGSLPKNSATREN
jgi:hypothetical protein